MAKSIHANKCGSGIKARGGDMHSPIAIPAPRKPVKVILAEIQALGPRPENRDVAALGKWVEDRDRLTYLLELHEVAS